MSEEKEEWDVGWIICGSGSDTFVGKRVDEPGPPGTSGGYAGPVRLYPCYKYVAHVIQVPQTDRNGRAVGINIVQQETVSSPSGAHFDLEVVVTPTWIMTGTKTVIRDEDESTYRQKFAEHVKRLVTMARQMQINARSAAAGIQTASRLT